MMILPLRRRPETPNLSEHALDDLRFIRSTMERAGLFTAVPGWGQVIVGATACAAAFFASREQARDGWVVVWLVEALVALVIGTASMAHKARMAGAPILHESGRRFALSFSLPLLAAGVLTLALWRAGRPDLLPGVWLLLYGSAFVAGGAFSVRIVRIMGLCFMLAGVGALFTPAAWGTAWMAASFGGLHFAFGLVIARRHGG